MLMYSDSRTSSDCLAEATWGADPLEYLGGFRALEYDETAQFRSSLSTNGTAKWDLVQAKQTSSSQSSANASLSIGYSNVDWTFLKVVYGWAAVQYQAWARGEIIVTADTTQNVILYTDMILEFWVDGVHYFGGDFFGFHRTPAVLRLKPGSHGIDVRLVRDVRAMGGVLEPTIDVLLELRQTSGALDPAREAMLLPDVVDGKLAGSVGSLYVRNTGSSDVEIINVESSDAKVALLKDGQDFVVVAGQTRPVAFNISLQNATRSSIEVNVNYKPIHLNGTISTLTISQNFTKRTLYSPHKITYLHPGGIVSYAMLRPPAKNATCLPGKNQTTPVLLQLHGAGLEAESEMVAHALDPVSEICAWVLFPTGVSPWSGDDWHNWGFADVEQAIKTIPSWIKDVGWQGPGVAIDRWVVSGHSNGGQGTWYALTHRPDNVIAAAPVSGYASIQKYVPYELWQPMDPRRTAIISASLNSYRHEMLMANARGITIVQQHGEMDDNVPAYNSRLLAQQLFQEGTSSSYYELPGQGHWFDVVMTTDQLKTFYREQTSGNKTTRRDLAYFEIVVADPGDMGSKEGLQVLHLEDPGQYGRVRVSRNTTLQSYDIQTSNILSFRLQGRYFEGKSVIVDGQPVRASNSTGTVQLSRAAENSWKIGPLHENANGVLARTGRQLGSMTALLRSHGTFTIRHSGDEAAHVALQVSRNLHQYFYADSRIVSPVSHESSGSGNVITVGIGDDVPESAHPSFPIQIVDGTVVVTDSRGHQRRYGDGVRVSTAFLRPLEDERLELVLWGSDSEGLDQAARLVPMLTGVGQPDFVVLGESASWKGVEGALAMGFFDHAWGVTRSSVVV